MFIARIALNEISAAEAACLSAKKGLIPISSQCVLGVLWVFVVARFS